jgi:hypothetical protein
VSETRIGNGDYAWTNARPGCGGPYLRTGLLLESKPAAVFFFRQATMHNACQLCRTCPTNERRNWDRGAALRYYFGAKILALDSSSTSWSAISVPIADQSRLAASMTPPVSPSQISWHAQRRHAVDPPKSVPVYTVRLMHFKAFCVRLSSKQRDLRAQPTRL